MRIVARQWLVLLVVLGGCGIVCSPAGAQDRSATGARESASPDAGTSPYAGASPLHTLRVFANLVQVPTLVLDQNGKPASEQAVGNFLISLDGGTRFPATHVRLQGEDPISLTVLIEASQRTSDLNRGLEAALSAMAQVGLRPRDRVSVYAIDCTVKRSADDVPTDAREIREAVERALASPGLHGSKVKGACAESLKLWDTMLYIEQRLALLPGRRILLAATEGQDGGSLHQWHEVLDWAEHDGVTVFGVRAAARAPDSGVMRNVEVRDHSFQGICQLSGGWTFAAETRTLALTLIDLMRMVRQRYIVQFPRGNTMTGGKHNIEVSTTRGHYTIHPAGLSVPLPDPALLNDPNVLPNDPTKAPEMGKQSVNSPR